MLYRNKSQLIRALVKPTDTVLDVGFAGQGIQEDDPEWPHRLLKDTAREVYGLDVVLPPKYRGLPRYKEANAEDFSFPLKFDVIFASEVIEHLSNPGLFLKQCRAHLKDSGSLILTTPNTFNVFSMAGKLTRPEPIVNPDHVAYYTSGTLSKLLQKNGMRAVEISYQYDSGHKHAESWKKKFLNLVNRFLALFTAKFVGTLVVVARRT